MFLTKLNTIKKLSIFWNVCSGFFVFTQWKLYVFTIKKTMIYRKCRVKNIFEPMSKALCARHWTLCRQRYDKMLSIARNVYVFSWTRKTVCKRWKNRMNWNVYDGNKRYFVSYMNFSEKNVCSYAWEREPELERLTGARMSKNKSQSERQKERKREKET